MKSVYILGLSALVILCVNSSQAYAAPSDVCNYNNKDDKLLEKGWKKSFEDEFDVSPNASYSKEWSIWGGGSFNNELQMYTSYSQNLNTVKDPDNFNSNKLLIIQANKGRIIGAKYRRDIDATPTSFDFMSARIESKKTFAPTNSESQLRISSRIKLPKGYAMWPAFWLYGDKWPTNGEIDILEARGNEPKTYSTNYHYGDKPDQDLAQNQEKYVNTKTNLTDCWHVYEVIWTKNSLTFLLDDQVVATQTGKNVEALFGKPERIVLNLAVGGNFFYPRPTAFKIPINPGEGIMQIDWVKVYSKK